MSLHREDPLIGNLESRASKTQKLHQNQSRDTAFGLIRARNSPGELRIVLGGPGAKPPVRYSPLPAAAGSWRTSSPEDVPADLPVPRWPAGASISRRGTRLWCSNPAFLLRDRRRPRLGADRAGADRSGLGTAPGKVKAACDRVECHCTGNSRKKGLGAASTIRSFSGPGSNRHITSRVMPR